MALRSITIAAWVSVALLGGECRVEAGYVASDMTSLQNAQQAATAAPFDEGAGPLSAEAERNTPYDSSPSVVGPALTGPGGSFSLGGMGAPPSESFDNGLSVTVIATETLVTDAPMLSWLRPGDSGWFPPDFSTGIFRPPRAIIG